METELIDKRIIEALKSKLDLSLSAIYIRIEKIREARGYIISTEQAAALLASENAIDISKFLTQEELSELRGLQAQPSQAVKKIVSKKMITQPKIMQFATGLRVQDPLLSDKILREAGEMAKVYPIIYTFENSVRNVISLVLTKKYGENWWDTQVKPKMRQKVKERMDKESANRWHGKRGSAPIFYTDISYLLAIIRDNWTDFVSLFPSQSWIESRISDIEMSRNIVAHNNPLAKRDVQRITVYFEDWIDQLKVFKGKV